MNKIIVSIILAILLVTLMNGIAIGILELLKHWFNIQFPLIVYAVIGFINGIIVTANFFNSLNDTPQKK